MALTKALRLLEKLLTMLLLMLARMVLMSRLLSAVEKPALSLPSQVTWAREHLTAGSISVESLMTRMKTRKAIAAAVRCKSRASLQRQMVSKPSVISVKGSSRSALAAVVVQHILHLRLTIGEKGPTNSIRSRSTGIRDDAQERL